MTDRECLACLAEILSYPSARTPDAARAILDRRRGTLPEAEVAALVRFLGGSSRDRMQELYTATFDLQPACAPYFGHHLLGEDSPMRGPLLAKLAEIYAAQGFQPREELGDHVAEVLRFLAAAPSTPERDDLARDGLLPALHKMIEGFGDETNPYRDVLALAERMVRGFDEHAAPGRVDRPERRAAP